VAAKLVPWGGQFLRSVGYEVLLDSVADYVRESGLRAARAALDLMTEGGFVTDLSDAHGDLRAEGAGNIYRSDSLQGICRVLPDVTYETCIGFWGAEGGRPYALEGPVLGSLYGTAEFLSSEGMQDVEVANAIVPRWAHAMGGGLRFTTDRAERKYRTGIGDMSVKWTRQTDWSGSASVDLPSLGTVEVAEVPFAFTGTPD
jgi:hypothetical protein